MSKIVLIDGHSILNRAFYGVPDLTNAKGLHTNAVYGFLNILFKILEEEKPDYLTVAFDVKAPTFRHEIYKDYKGTRKPMPEELREQVPVMKEVLKAMGVLVIEKAGLEADDILGTIAKRSEKAGFEVSLVSGDRDLLQIATEHIKIRIPKTKGGKTEIEDYYAADVERAYQVNPIQFIDLKALMGDTADNIPGVPKVGEKTATSLMVEYGSLEGIYEHVEEISKKSIRESLIANKDLADLSKVLATINIDAEIDFSYEKAKLENLYTEEAYEKFLKVFLSVPRSLCHDDLLPFNVISNNEKAALIDWECGGILPYPTSFARLIAHTEDNENALFYMKESDKCYAINYYYEKLLKEKGISYADWLDTLEFFLYYEYCEWIYVGNKYNVTDGKYFKKYLPIAKLQANKILGLKKIPFQL